MASRALRLPPPPLPDTTAPTPSTPGSAIPQKAEDVDAKKGSETGMVGGASGTTASGGKPGADMPSTGGAAQTTGEPSENRN
ncbi:MAG: hypothetical protein WBA53_10785 [Burkholderiaceae bacterium]